MQQKKMKYKHYKELPIWQEAHSFVLKIYQITGQFPSIEKYTLTSQLRRAAISVPSNIVEGYHRYGSKELSRYLTIARGSLLEAEYQLLLAKDLGYLSEESYLEIYDDFDKIHYQINSWLKSLK